MRRPESVPHPPNRGAVDRDAMGLGQVQHELIECALALRANTGLDPIRHSHARRHCLSSWGQRSRLTPWFHRVIDELRRSPQECRAASR